jgi:hypothetical protein
MQALTFFFAFCAFVIVLIVVGGSIVWVLRRQGILKPREARVPVYRGTGGLQRAAMNIAETASILLMVATTIIFAVAGAIYAKIFAFGGGIQNSEGVVVLGSIVSGLAGFMLSSILMAFVFTLAAIERNTRHTAKMFDKIANRSS